MMSNPGCPSAVPRMLAALLSPGPRLLGWVFLSTTALAQLETNTAPLALWDVSTRLSAGGGYRGNVLLSSVRPEGSSFIEASADFSAIRLSETGSSFTLFVLGELQRYLDSEQVENEGILYAVARMETPLDPANTIGGESQYLYQNQILDVSETEAVLRRARVLGHGLSFKPDWEHSLNDAWSLRLEGTALRQLFEEELDDYWEGFGRLTLDYAYGNRSTVSVGYELRHRFYDTREQYDDSGAAVPRTDLVYRYHEAGGEWRHHWDAERRWRTTLKAGFLRNEDNGSGYFNYDRVQVSAQVRWREGGWDARLQGRGGWYWYPNQQVLGEERVRSLYALELRVERQIDSHWLLYAAASREWNLSNEPLEEYTDWMASGGIGVEL
jgi:hypothetical protein